MNICIAFYHPHNKGIIQQSNVLGDGCLWGWVSLHHHLCFLCCHLLQVGVDMCMTCVWCSLSSGYHQKFVSFVYFSFQRRQYFSRMRSPKAHVTNVSEFEPLDGEHEKQRELVILIWASVFCLVKQLMIKVQDTFCTPPLPPKNDRLLLRQ